MKESIFRKAVKRLEIAIRRGFIASLQFRGRFRSKTDKSGKALPLQLPEHPTILFLRQDRLGDAIVSTPVFLALYKKYPAAHFIMLLGENNKGMADLLPIPCEIVIYRKKPFADLVMLSKLRRRKIDVLIDLMDNPSSTSSILTAAISARYSVGIEKENSSSYTHTVPLVDRAKFHVARRIAELVRPFGIDPDSLSLRPVLKDLVVQQTPGRIGLVISAGAASRYASVEANAGIAAGVLAEGYATEVIIFFHPKDKKLAEQIIDRTNDSRIKLGKATTKFAEYAAQIKSCELIISPDTSALHLCSAYGIPVVGLYAPFPPELHYWTPIGVPYEMIVQEPSLESLAAADVIELVRKLRERVKPQVRQEAITSA
ncbi:MAG: glycosyltransferase family 9 protein [Bacteroidota bacterium]|nr:glycosyltransferase family 9 protein [Bacteroidota bacterium]MDP4229335.1 glycosyltransferase family 9 protein [Bacteroidota bacterium]MDP4236919.1 glycosyltransferase family 9 protein [Bacteroidota bacterium]